MVDDWASMENWEEPPLCKLCDTTPMNETETGYICPNCRATLDWNEDTGVWIEKPGETFEQWRERRFGQLGRHIFDI